MVRKDKLVSSDCMMSSKTNKMMGDGRINQIKYDMLDKINIIN